LRANNFSLDDYLRRIDFNGDCRPDIDSLSALMSRQLEKIPFENLDVRAGIPISIEPEAIVDKILHRDRGGYCFELNGLFAILLGELGIDYRLVAARPLLYAKQRPRSHVAIVVELQGKKWLCDLGFGRYGLRSPICLDDLDTELKQGYDRFLLTLADTGFYRLSAWVDENWGDQYEFDLSPQTWIDFEPANYYTSTHPDSIFVNNLVVLRFTAQGRKILWNDRLKTIESGQVGEKSITATELIRVLREEFDLEE